jgi:inner membrane transporter RhtA
VALGVVLAAMNSCFYEAIARLPLSTVSAIEFLPVIVLAAIGVRSPRNLSAVAIATGGVYVLIDVRLRGGALGFGLAFANAALFALYIVLAHRAAQHPAITGIDGLGLSMLFATVAVTPLAGWAAVPALTDATALLAGAGVGISSSVIPYIADQLAMRELPRATYALMVSLLPATATVVGVVVLAQLPSAAELAGVALVVAGVALNENDPDRETRVVGARPPRGGRSARGAARGDAARAPRSGAPARWRRRASGRPARASAAPGHRRRSASR